MSVKIPKCQWSPSKDICTNVLQKGIWPFKISGTYPITLFLHISYDEDETYENTLVGRMYIMDNDGCIMDKKDVDNTLVGRVLF